MPDPLPPLEITYDEPAAPTAAPIVLLPAMGVPARVYTSFAEHLVALGHPVARVHWRDEDREFPLEHPDYGYADLAERDVPQAVAAVRDRYASDPLVVGHSLGGQIATIAAARSGPLAGVAIIASGSNYWRGSGAQWALAVGFASTLAAPIAVRAFGYWPGGRFKFGGRQPARLMRDWARLGRTGRFELEGESFDHEAALKDFTHPVLSIAVSGDTYVSEGAADNLLGKLVNAESIERVYWKPEDKHQRGHFNWVRPGDWPAQRIHDWCESLAEKHFATT